LRHFGISERIRLGQKVPEQQLHKARVFLGLVLAIVIQDNAGLKEEGKQLDKDRALL
jgi:hypothetical protein